MDHLKNYKAFVSAVEAAEYRNNIGGMACIFGSILLIGSLAYSIFYTLVIILMIASLFISLSAGYLIVKRRLKRNYYGTAQTNASDILTVPGIAVFAGAVGHFGGKLVSKTPADFSHTII